MIKSSQVSVGLLNPKSPTNVGAVMRAAGCYQVDAVYYTGRRYAFASKFQTDTQDISETIPLEGRESFLDCVPEDTALVCVELVEGATPLPEFEHPENAFYVFGPEDGSVDQALVDQAQAVVYVPTVGCMNLAATVNVLLYDRLAKSKHMQQGDDLIRQSRDQNNRVKVRKTSAAQR